jgi:hypothetical protein
MSRAPRPTLGDTSRAMSHENVELVKRFIAPPETDYTVLFGDDL